MSHTVGLRFRREDAAKMQGLVDQWVGEGSHSEHVALFKRAADDARRGEPMKVLCETPDEAQILASGFVLYGINRPAVEALS